VYLNEVDKRISFWKGNIIDFADPNPKLRWIELEHDLINEHHHHHHYNNAGIVSLRLSVSKNEIDWNEYPAWNMEIKHTM
jgi:hypothetical protein